MSMSNQPWRNAIAAPRSLKTPGAVGYRYVLESLRTTSALQAAYLAAFYTSSSRLIECLRTDVRPHDDSPRKVSIGYNSRLVCPSLYQMLARVLQERSVYPFFVLAHEQSSQR